MEIPLNIELTDDVIGKMAARRRLAAGKWFAFLIQPGAERKISEKKHLMLNMQLAPLRNPDDQTTQTGPMVRHNLVMPWKNPNEPTHEPPNTSGLCLSFCRAIYGNEVPKFPFKDSKRGGRWFYQDREVNEQDIDDLRKEVGLIVSTKLLEFWRNPELLSGHRIFGYTKHEGDFTSLDKVAYELPKGQQLAHEKEFVVD